MLCETSLDLWYSIFSTFVIPNTKAVEVTRDIVEALNIEEPKVDLSKFTAQTYDGDKNMQDHLSGVQKSIEDGYYTFAANIHSNNHTMKLSVKGMSNGHTLVGRTCDKCRITVKLINYSPKRTAHFEKVTACEK